VSYHEQKCLDLVKEVVAKNPVDVGGIKAEVFYLLLSHWIGKRGRLLASVANHGGPALDAASPQLHPSVLELRPGGFTYFNLLDLIKSESRNVSSGVGPVPSPHSSLTAGSVEDSSSSSGSAASSPMLVGQLRPVLLHFLK